MKLKEINDEDVEIGVDKQKDGTDMQINVNVSQVKLQMALDISRSTVIKDERKENFALIFELNQLQTSLFVENNLDDLRSLFEVKKIEIREHALTK